jgi:hypothetical protein
MQGYFTLFENMAGPGLGPGVGGGVFEGISYVFEMRLKM